MSEAARTFKLPFFMRKTLGMRARNQIPFDQAVKVRFGDSAWMLTHPDDIKHVLVSKAGNYVKTSKLTSEAGRLRAGRGLLTSTGSDHHKQRRLLQPLFDPIKLEPFCEHILECTQQMLNSWQDGMEIDIFHAMADLSQNIIIRCLFGELNPQDLLKVKKAINARRRYTQYIYHSKIPFRDRISTRTVKENRTAVAFLDTFIQGQIDDRSNSGLAVDNFLSMFLAARYADGSAMSAELVRDEVKTMTSTGYETLGEGLAWSWYLMSKNPKVEQLFRLELKSVLKGIQPGHRDYNSLNQVECIFREAMRLLPPTWVFERIPIAADLLPSGLHVPVGASLYLCPYVMHRHPRFFPDPDSFRPERFKNQKRRAYRFAYMPFGDGLHACLGENFAMLQGVLVMATIGQQVEFNQPLNHRLRPKAGITLSAQSGYSMQVRRHG